MPGFNFGAGGECIVGQGVAEATVLSRSRVRTAHRSCAHWAQDGVTSELLKAFTVQLYMSCTTVLMLPNMG